MSDKTQIAFFVVGFLVCLSLAITFFALEASTVIFTVPGTLQRIVSCEERCYVGGADGGCFNVTIVAFNWTVKNTTYDVKQFTCGIAVCGDCCYQFVNHTIQVEISPDNPQVPERFWTELEQPHSVTFGVLAILATLLTISILGVGILTAIRYYRQHGFTQLN